MLPPSPEMTHLGSSSPGCDNKERLSYKTTGTASKSRAKGFSGARLEAVGDELAKEELVPVDHHRSESLAW
ncbi:hypothetical protein L596_002000 [Steinernema carpocapsae]|uniref:Uncharacterized protein n=1 Tax=Steinernema carpocapsae TaxID=34508 RepID=A0A4U8UMW4_STECR|nr:hypothetical protein L596_002000 [Steinernema carpocapsae]